MGRTCLRQLQERYGPALEAESRAWLDRRSLPEYYGMLQYAMGFAGPDFQPVSVPAGKRFRPLLCLAACEGSGGEPRAALPLAVGIELLHNFSLIHDDIEDKDPQRHHRPTLWTVWGEPTAINAGDGMFALAMSACLAIDEPPLGMQVARAFVDTALDLTEGQHLDMSFEARGDVSVAEYLRMIDLKSGALIAFSLWSGAYVGGADDAGRDLLLAFGRNLGRAFQMADDIRGIWATRDETGKAEATDLENRKKTLPVLLAWDRASGEEREVLEAFFSRKSQSVEQVQEILDRTGAREAAMAEVEVYRQAALDCLQGSGLRDAERENFECLARELTA